MPASELGGRPNWFLQDDAPPRYAVSVRRWLDEYFTDGLVDEIPRNDHNITEHEVYGFLCLNLF
jgi:hypothetical protein